MTSPSRINPFRDTRVAREYDPWYADPIGATVDRLQKALVFRIAQPRAGERALDVGTGTGNYACALARLGLRVTGIDASEAMLSVARAKPEPVMWQQGSAEHLPCEDASFRLVISVTALEFFADPERAIAEMVRVLAPGGGWWWARSTPEDRGARCMHPWARIRPRLSTTPGCTPLRN